MQCERCQCTKHRVNSTAPYFDKIKRWKVCTECAYEFTTVEYMTDSREGDLEKFRTMKELICGNG